MRLARQAIDTALARGAQYVDVRIRTDRHESIDTRNGHVDALGDTTSQGIGVRVLKDGAWGFAASPECTGAEADRVAALAVTVADASATAIGRRAVLVPAVPVTDEWATPCEEDPFGVSLATKVDMLLAADAAMGAVNGVTTRKAHYSAWLSDQHFLNSEGAEIRQRILHCGGGITATAVRDGDVQVRSYPNSFRGQFLSGGFEVVREFDLIAHAPRVAEEAVALHQAKPCPTGETTLILDGSQLALQVHESCGHPIELDRVLGDEANFAGTSFLTLDQRNTLQYGSTLVNLVADATWSGHPRGLGSFAYDDEGVPAQCTPIVTAGRFVGYMTSRETGTVLGEPSTGAMRASGWDRFPLIRMTNVSLLPGAGSLEALFADVDHGVYMETNRSWSIDDRRLNFQFGTEIGWEIKNGKRGRMLKNPTYGGVTPRFWNGCDGIAGPDAWRIWGTPNCGKGQPMQIAHTGHGAAPARFRHVQVGLG